MADTKTLNMTSTLQDELDGFVRYSRLGLFQEAKDIYGDVLKSHEHMFPVTAEYADHLLERGSYRELHSFLDQKLKVKGEHSYKDDEVALLCLWKDFANLHLQGEFRKARQAARAWRQNVAASMSRDSLSVVEVIGCRATSLPYSCILMNVESCYPSLPPHCYHYGV
jgi:hypothetical protein